MTEHHEDWQKRVKGDPFAGEPFTEKHKQRVMQTVKRISQRPAPKKQTIWLKRILPAVAVCGSLLAAIWWFLPGTEFTPSQPDMISMSEAGPSADSTTNSMDSEPYSINQKGAFRDSDQHEEIADSSAKEDQSKLRFSDQELGLQNLVKEADLIVELRITKTNRDGFGLQADVKNIITSHVNEVPSTLKINISETMNLSGTLLSKEDRVILFLKKTKQSDTYDLAGETQNVYVVSADNHVSSIESITGSSAMDEIPYDEFIENMKALEDH